MKLLSSSTLSASMRSTGAPSKIPVLGWKLWSGLCLLALAVTARAFPPAPDHIVYGQVRDEMGNPLRAKSAEVWLETAAGVRLRTRIVPGIEPGLNYRLAVPMDSGLTADQYKPTALRPAVPFTMWVRLNGTVFLPIEVRLTARALGRPGEKTRLDLTLGEDSDGDGLPDAWERAMMAAFGQGSALADLNPKDDLDQDKLSNMDEYLAGTYAFDPLDGFQLTIVSYNQGAPVIEFMGIPGRAYSILGSQNMGQWWPVAFKPLGAQAPVSGEYHAGDVGALRMEILPVEPSSSAFMFFKLMVR